MAIQKYLLLLMLAFAACGVHANGPLSADSISHRIIKHISKTPQEKIYVHTDRTHYLPGDTVWLRAHLIDAATNLPDPKSKFVYIELLDNASDTLVSRLKIKADTNDVIANILPLSPALSAGSYTLVAYTRWMENFGEELFFKKLLKIVSHSDSLSPAAPPRNVKDFSLHVMPEGGNLIAGHIQRVAYKAVADDGLGIDVNVRLTDASGNTLAEGTSEHLGMGCLWTQPEPGVEMWLEAVTTDGLKRLTPLLQPITHGATLKIDQRKEMILIQPFLTPSLSPTQLALTIYGAGNLYVKELTDINAIRIPATALHPGVINVALIDRETGHPYAKRLIFVRDTRDIPLTINTPDE